MDFKHVWENHNKVVTIEEQKQILQRSLLAPMCSSSLIGYV